MVGARGDLIAAGCKTVAACADRLFAHLRLAGFFDWIAESVIERLHPHHLMPTVVFTTGLLSAFLVNGIVCLVMTPFVLHMTRRLIQ